MEKLELKVKDQYRESLVAKKIIFDWKVEDDKLENGVHHLTLVRDNETPYYEELVKLEKSFKDAKVPSLKITLIFPILAFILITLFVILYFNFKDTVNFFYLFLPTCLPAFLLLGAGVGLITFRIHLVEKNEKEKDAKVALYKSLVEELKKGK